MSTTTLSSQTDVPKKKKGVALAGVAAGTTAICTVGHTGNDLHYRGYDIIELAKHATFEEVAYLLIHGALPTKSQLTDYHQKLKKLRGLPEALKKSAGADSRECAPDGRDAYRLLHAGHTGTGSDRPQH
jgi:2-methylcitrate synthase